MKPLKLVTALSLTYLLFSCNNSSGEYDATGSFEATEIIVSSQANGVLLDLTVEDGDQLNEGQKVGQIDSTQLYLQKMSLLSNAEGIRSQQPDIRKQTAAIQEQIRTLERERARVKNLLASNAANQKQLDDIEAQINVQQKQLLALTSTLEKSSKSISAQSSTLEIQIAQLNDQLEKTQIVSPITGTVLNTYAEEGELATMGTPLFKIADTSTLYLRAYVTNDQLAQIKLNDEVTVRVDNGEGNMKTYNGTIRWISDKSEFTPKTIQTKNERANLVYALKIAVPNDGYLKIGMYGEVKFK
ncbi:MAG: HlyD family efflux transporter periplasmic adaptor subunit [Proteiniphilum sp.]|jgi:HlyD family secretion protein|nr:HlyD family efflux transporter periplasmic adaptor subunit [Proteiniphilum sp.]MDD3556628.1 HlyD family efflux transporter periplasmic adaptor subunit [Proteiniphilum sp.]MDD4486951.1 HlyD family efflux transporter periplasmic adaptor subunit [Proteiniphilum sp.]MDD5620438.1 HlyD family efflux transporter periplasmic adaptor subunit [Proteiniphilum sp.]MDY0183145.1 HlyD family efflux transporter periplasmic adaptor subunit [Proteiniphilum sp.]